MLKHIKAYFICLPDVVIVRLFTLLTVGLCAFQNSGLFQGTLLRRHRIPRREPLHGERAFWHWTDFKLGRRNY